MKLTTIFLLIACMQLSAAGYGQRISISGQNMTLKKVFTEIQKQSGYSFLYYEEDLEQAKKVTINARSAELIQVLNYVFQDQPLAYTIIDKTIVVKRKTVKEEPPTLSPPFDVRGRVTNEDGEPVPGVTVTVKGTKNGTSTNDNGVFILKDVDPQSTLLFTSTNLETAEVKIAGRTNLQVQLKLKIHSLEQTQIIAYGKTSVRLQTGAVSTVKAETIEKQPVSNLLAALSGLVPGLDLQQRTAVPGAATRFNIRGLNSLQGNGGEPLIIIDGVPFFTTNLATGSNGNNYAAFGGFSTISSINPADIESIEVLKDADATAIYGSRGANGVILITSKRGKTGKSNVDINFYKGIGKLGNKLRLLTTRQYLDMRYEAFANDGVNWKANNVNAPDLKSWDTTRYTDWQETLAGGTAHITNAQVSFNDGNKQTSFAIAGSYWKEGSIYSEDFKDEKLSGRIGINHRSVNERFRLDFSSFYVYNDLLQGAFNPYTSIIGLPPIAPKLYNADGSFNWENGTFTNPAASLLNTISTKSHNINASLLLSYRLGRGFWFRSQLGYNRVDHDIVSINPKKAANPFSTFIPFAMQAGRYADSRSSNVNIEPYAEYETTLGPGKLNALLGFTIQTQNVNQEVILADDFLDDALMYNYAAAKNITVSAPVIAKYRYNAIFSRLNYNIYNKYLINLTARRDGSSRFGPGRQFGNFGAVGAAWIFTEESFIKKALPFLSYGKLRASYGITGSDNIGDYSYLSTMAVRSIPQAGFSILRSERLFNPDYGWESNRKSDVELTLGVLNDRVTLSANYFNNRSSSQLVGIPMPRITGFNRVNGNLDATVQNTGWEFVLNTDNIKSKNFQWNSSINLTFLDNKLLSYPNLASSTHANTLVVGQPISLVKLYDFVGVNPQTGVNVYKDRNGKDTSFITSAFFTQADRVINVNTLAKFYGGWRNTVTYKQLALDFILHFSERMKADDIATLPGTPGFANNITAYVYNNSWRKPGDVALFQKFTQATNTPTYRSRTTSASEAHYNKVWIVRMNNLSLAYDLPPQWMQKLKFSSCRVYMLAQNLFTLTNFEGVDPEGGTTSMPRMRILTAGVQIKL